MFRSAVFAAIVLAVLLGSSGASGSSSITVQIHLHGFGRPLGTSAACPDGQTAVQILGSSGRRAGSLRECVLRVRKVSKAGLDPWRIFQSAKQSIPLVGDMVRTRVTETFTFRRDGYSEARFVGRITGGKGRYAGVTGVVSGAGSGHDDTADWLLRLRIA